MAFLTDHANNIEAEISVIKKDQQVLKDENNATRTMLGETRAEVSKELKEACSSIRAEMEKRVSEGLLEIRQHMAKDSNLGTDSTRMVSSRDCLGTDGNLSLNSSSHQTQECDIRSVSTAPTKDKINGNLKLPIYDGSFRADSYVIQAQAIACHNGWTDLEFACSLSAALKGPALRIRDLFMPAVQPSPKMILDALIARFGDQLTRQEASAKLNRRVQQKGETLRQLGAEIDSLVNHAHPNADSRTIGEIAVREFIRAILNDDVRKQVALAQPVNLQSAIKVAEETEAILKDTARKSGAAFVMAMENDEEGKDAKRRDDSSGEAFQRTVVSHMVAAVDKGIQQLRQELKNGMPQLERNDMKSRGQRSLGKTPYTPACLRQDHPWEERANPYSTVQCYNCGKSGHYARDCRAISSDRQGNSSPRGVLGDPQRR
jgi:hypothetical protein